MEERELKSGVSGTRWGQERRLEFIEFRLRWEGRINRSELVDHFGISVPQASADIAKYAETAASNLAYDKTAKAYVTASAFVPAFGGADAQRYLSQLWNLEAGLESSKQSFIGWRPSSALVCMPERTIDAKVLAEILLGIRLARQVRIDYQSLSQPLNQSRCVEPHALAHDGSRWHVRAWCELRQEFRDFVLSRIGSAQVGKARVVDPQRDDRWNTIVTLEIAPRPEFSAPQRWAVAHEYGMHNGVLMIEARAAMLHYLVRHLQLDRAPTDQNSPPLVWRNRAALAHHLLPNM